MEKCVICDIEMEKRQSCNPFPISEEGRCCLLCDRLLVAPARMILSGVPIDAQTQKLIEQLKGNPTAKLKVEIISG